MVFPGIYCGHGTVKSVAGYDSTIEFTRECVELLATECESACNNDPHEWVIGIEN